MNETHEYRRNSSKILYNRLKETVKIKIKVG